LDAADRLRGRDDLGASPCARCAVSFGARCAWSATPGRVARSSAALSPTGASALYRVMSPVRRTMVRLGVDSGLSALRSHGEPTSPGPRS